MLQASLVAQETLIARTSSIEKLEQAVSAEHITWQQVQHQTRATAEIRWACSAELASIPCM